MTSNSKLVSESVFFRFLVDFWPILDQFGLQKWRRRSGWDGSASASQLKLRFKGDLDATWNLSRSILDVGTVFEAILAPKMIQKSTKNRSKIDVWIRLHFFIIFFSKICFTSKPRTSKIIKNFLVFQHFSMFSILQVILKCDQNLKSFLFQNWSKFTKHSLKKHPEWFQNNPKWGPDGLWSPLGGRGRYQNRFPWFDSAIFGAKISQKSIKNRKNIDSKTNFEFDTIFWSILDEILINFEAKMRPNFD